ncbi:MAG: glycosyltransferase [Candidatus Aenigmarchaeota archaeon]|nr:glycosyltransferase [Candidatus Aenigmarchaeota archaeon]
MKVCLLTYQIGRSLGTGIERYVAELYDGLIGKNVGVDLIVKNDGVTGIPLIHDNVVIPVKSISKLDKKTVFHAISSRQATHLPWISKKKSVVTINAVIPLMEIELGDSPLPHIAEAYGKYIFRMVRKTGRIIAVSSLVKKQLVEKIGADEDKITVVNYGINEQFKPMKIEKKVKKVGYIGGLTPRKRVDVAVRTFDIFTQSYPDINCEFDIYGPKNPKSLTNEYPKLLEMKKNRGLDNLFFKGLIKDHEIVAGYNSFDVFIFPTVYEGFGLPMIEAQRCGVPVITMKDGNIPEEVVEKTIQCDDEEDAAEKMYKLLTNDKYREKISREGLKYSQKFTWEKCVNKTIEVYKDLL